MQTHVPRSAAIHNHDKFHRRRPLMPPIPDLRFEQSYLKKLEPFVRFTRNSGGNGEQRAGTFEVVDIEWGRVFWVTVRDQVLGPLVQGTLLTILAFYFTPISSQLGRSLKKRRKEGLGVGWLRGWVQSLGLSTGTTAGR